MPPRPWWSAGGCSPVVMHEIGGRHDCDRAGVAGSARALRVPPGSADGVDQAAYAAFSEVGAAGGTGGALGQVVFAVLGVLVMTSEYSSGTIRCRRGPG